jgi:hypothetical protein
MTTKEQVTSLILNMDFLPNCPITEWNAELVVNSYHEVLSDIPYDLLKNAVLAYKSTGTFFPTPGDIRNKVMELQSLAAGIPSANEAWSMFLNSEKKPELPKLCDTGYELFEEANGAPGEEYSKKLFAYSDHTDTCPICNRKTEAYEYGHPIVKKVVDLLGGREHIFTDNPTADRARFIEGYKEITQREIKIAGLPSQVRDVLSAGRHPELKDGSKNTEQLLKRLTQNNSR